MLERAAAAAKLGVFATALVVLVAVAGALWIFREVIRRPKP